MPRYCPIKIEIDNYSFGQGAPQTPVKIPSFPAFKNKSVGSLRKPRTIRQKLEPLNIGSFDGSQK